jgi:hypothetical protein
MSYTAQLLLIFLLLLGLSIVVYLLTVRAFYWGDRGGPPKKQAKGDETPPQD